MAIKSRAAAKNHQKINTAMGPHAPILRGRGGKGKFRPFRIGGTAALESARAQALGKLKPADFKELGLSAKSVEGVLNEVARRHAHEEAPHHTLFGTFVEVTCSIHPDVIDFRAEVIPEHLKALTRVAMLEIDCLHGMNSKGAAVMESLNLSDFPLIKGSKVPAVPIRKAFPNAKAFEAAIDDFCEQFQSLIDPEAIVHRSDTMIEGSKYTDRSSTIRLKDGREIFLLGEEYKGRRSRGGEAQSAVRIDRVLNDPRVKPGDKISGILDDPLELAKAMNSGATTTSSTKPPVRSEVEVAKVRFNMMTFTQDQILIKATNAQGEAQYVQVQRSKRYVKRKAVYGGKFKAGKDASEGLYRYQITFPSRRIHALLRKLEAAGR